MTTADGRNHTTAFPQRSQLRREALSEARLDVYACRKGVSTLHIEAYVPRERIGDASLLMGQINVDMPLLLAHAGLSWHDASRRVRAACCESFTPNFGLLPLQDLLISLSCYEKLISKTIMA